MNKLKIALEKEIELPDDMTIEELNQLARYVAMREEELFTNNKNISKNKINMIKVFLEKHNGEVFKLPDQHLPEFVLHGQDRKILQFPTINREDNDYDE